MIVLKKSVARKLPVLLVDSGGAVVTGVAVGSVTVVTSKDGGALTAFTLTGKWTELGQGLYTISFADTDLDTIGFFAYLVTVTGCDQYSGIMYVDDALPTDAENADAVWDEVISAGAHDVANSPAIYLRNLYQTIVTRIALATGGATGSITLDALASAVNDYYKGQIIAICGGTGAGQARACYEYTGGTKVALIRPAWATNPDGTSWFAILNIGSSVVAAIDDIDFSATMKDSIDTAIADLAVETTVQSGIVDARDAIISNETTMETNLTTILTAIKGVGWSDENLTTIDGLIDDIKAKTENLPTDPADESSLEAAISTAESNIRGTDADTLKTLSGQLDLTALEATLTTMKGVGWATETLVAIKAAVDTNGDDIDDVLGNQVVIDGKLDTIDTNLDTTQIDLAYVKQKESGRWKIASNQLTYYDDDGTTVLRRFNLFNRDGVASNENPYERVPV